MALGNLTLRRAVRLLLRLPLLHRRAVGADASDRRGGRGRARRHPDPAAGHGRGPVCPQRRDRRRARRRSSGPARAGDDVLCVRRRGRRLPGPARGARAGHRECRRAGDDGGDVALDDRSGSLSQAVGVSRRLADGARAAGGYAGGGHADHRDRRPRHRARICRRRSSARARSCAACGRAMSLAIKCVEKAATVMADGAWFVFSRVNRIRPGRPFTPAWSDIPLSSAAERGKPPLGWPRETDSLCPACVREVRAEILSGRADPRILQRERPAEIKAAIVERDGRLLMEKTCSRHGRFEDVLSIDPAFSRHLEQVFPGRDLRAHADAALHDHGSSTIKYGRGAVLTVDLTNRCHMMCEPCFMDANQVGFVHELTWPEIKTLLDNAATIKPRRQMSIQFSGGEPTLSPHFLEAVRYARQVGYRVVQAATNGIEFARSAQFARAAGEAGLRYAYLQFDGIGNAANTHRGVGNLFDVKLRAIENLWAGGVSVVPVITIVNGINNEQVGRLIRFALDNPRRIAMLSFQPVSFSGRDENITPERRAAQRYTLSHLAHDVKRQT